MNFDEYKTSSAATQKPFIQRVDKLKDEAVKSFAAPGAREKC